MLDVLANSQLSAGLRVIYLPAGDCTPSPKIRLSGRLSVGLSRSVLAAVDRSGQEAAVGRGVWYVVLRWCPPGPTATARVLQRGRAARRVKARS